MYAKLCQLEILSPYISDLTLGDVLAVEARVTNPLDWHHFYEKLSVIKEGNKTDFTIVTDEGDRIVGSGDVEDIEKWSNNGQFGFKIKVKIKKQKSLSDRRIRIRQSDKLTERKVEPRISSKHDPPKISQSVNAQFAANTFT
jgi:hypothetical protein